MRYFVIAMLLLCSTALQAKSSIEPYIQTNDYLDMAISPDGKTIAAVVFDGEVYALVFMDSESLDIIDVMKLRYPDTVGPFRWVNNERVVMDVYRYNYHRDGYFTVGELFSVKVSDTKGKYIFGYRAGRPGASDTSKAKSIAGKHRNMSRAWNRVIDLLEDDPNHILVAAKPWREDRASKTHIYRVNVEDGNIYPVSIFDEPYADIFTDGKGNLVGAWQINDDLSTDVFLYDKSSDKWQVVKALSDIDDFRFQSYEAEKKQLLFTARLNSDTAALYAYNIGSGALTQVYRNEYVDIDWVLTSGNDRTGYSIVVADGKRQQVSVNPEYPISQLYQAMVDGFKGHTVRILNSDKSGQKSLFSLESDTKPRAYYFYDAKKGKPVLIAHANKALASETAQTMLPFQQRINNADVRGYITLPDVKGKAPVVVMLSGHPQAGRFYWRYDAFAQMYAAQGYAVIQLNLPGTYGFGKKNDEIGLQQWQKTQYDLIKDALAQLGEQYDIDTGKACIQGHRWGAYMAVMAARYQPETFRCVVAREGYYDFAEYRDEFYIDSFHFAPAWMGETLGGDASALAPYDLKNHISNVKTATLFVHPEFQKIQSLGSVEDFQDVLKKNGVTAELHEISRTYRNDKEFKEKVKAQKAIFEFLEKHL